MKIKNNNIPTAYCFIHALALCIFSVWWKCRNEKHHEKQVQRCKTSTSKENGQQENQTTWMTQWRRTKRRDNDDQNMRQAQRNFRQISDTSVWYNFRIWNKQLDCTSITHTHTYFVLCQKFLYRDCCVWFLSLCTLYFVSPNIFWNSFKAALNGASLFIAPTRKTYLYTHSITEHWIGFHLSTPFFTPFSPVGVKWDIHNSIWVRHASSSK